MIKMKNKLIQALVVCSLILCTTACGRPPMGMQGGVPVESLVLKSTPVSQSSIYQGTLISRFSVSLQPQVEGQVSGIFVKAGERVKAGQLLMLIDKRKQEAILNSTRADAAAIKSSITQAQDMLDTYKVQRESLESNLVLNQKQYNRYSALYAQKAVSQQDLEKYTDSLTKAKAELSVNDTQISAQKSAILTAKSNYQRALSNIQEQSVQLKYYKIVAPYSGVIGDIPVKLGNYVVANTQLLSLTQNDPLEINIGLPVEKVFDIRIGLPVEVLDNNGVVVGRSTISFISPKVDTATQTILVKAILSNKSEILKADQSIKARVTYSKAEGVLAPTNAISHLGGQDFAFVITNKGKQQVVMQRPVKLGSIQNNKYIVLSGLNAGDEIVSEGIQKLMDGAPVMSITKGK